MDVLLSNLLHTGAYAVGVSEAILPALIALVLIIQAVVRFFARRAKKRTTKRMITFGPPRKLYKEQWIDQRDETCCEDIGADLLSRKIVILPDMPASSAAIEEE